MSSPIENNLMEILLSIIEANQYQEYERRLALGAAFDLVVASTYYGAITSTGWLQCTSSDPVAFYPYTNTCPHCLFDGRFEYHKANKPKSGIIGESTSRLLGVFFQKIFQKQGVTLHVIRGGEPIDIIFVDEQTQPITVFCAEVKSSPLVTLPLSTWLRPNSLGHQKLEIRHLNTPLNLFVPYQSNPDHWTGTHFHLGVKQNAQDTEWAFRGLISLLDDPAFFKTYFIFWQDAFSNYTQRKAHPTYWLVNGCGQPIPRPTDWPKRSGTGYETVSDGKSSVGMDRTDDIKKATYQVLRLGVMGKFNSSYTCKVGIVSNIHAARHFEEYLAPLINLVWTTHVDRNKSQPPINAQIPLFNLFDGLVSLTQTTTQDEWVNRRFNL